MDEQGGDRWDPDDFYRSANRGAGDEYGRRNYERILWRHQIRRIVGLVLGLGTVLFVVIYLERH